MQFTMPGVQSWGIVTVIVMEFIFLLCSEDSQGFNDFPNFKSEKFLCLLGSETTVSSQFVMFL